MNEQIKQHRLELFNLRCQQGGVPVTVQRRAILETVLDLDEHPTAEQIHEAVADRLPQVSRTTVYRTLETLVHMGLISRACHPGSVVRYDNRTENHHHLICLHCDRVLDVMDSQLDELPLPDISDTGFEVAEVRVQLRGICRQCRERGEG